MWTPRQRRAANRNGLRYRAADDLEYFGSGCMLLPKLAALGPLIGCALLSSGGA
jgi:hypothetical protein